MIGVSGGLDSTHALIVAAKAIDRLGLPRANILAYTMPGLRHQRATPRRNACALMDALGVTARGDRHPARRHADARATSATRSRRASRSTTSPSRTCRRAAHRLPVPPRQPARRARARHRRPVRAGARLVHLRRRRPDVALQRQRLGAQDADPAPDPLGDRRPASSTRRRPRRCTSILDTEISPELVPGRRPGEPAAEHARPRSAPTSCRTSTSTTSLRYGFRPRKVAFLAWHAWRDAATRRLAAGLPGRAARTPTTCATIKHWLEVFLLPLLRDQPVQALGHARTGRRSAPAARSRRAATGARPPTATRAWLDELERNVPKG